MKRTCLLIAILTLSGIQSLSAQKEGGETNPDKKEFTVSLEFRPRTEYRNGYRVMRSDSTHAAVFTEGRSRLLFNFKMKNFIFHTSFQDIRVWGEKDPRSTAGTLQIFEAYVEPTLAKNCPNSLLSSQKSSSAALMFGILALRNNPIASVRRPAIT